MQLGHLKSTCNFDPEDVGLEQSAGAGQSRLWRLGGAKAGPWLKLLIVAGAPLPL